MHSFARLRGLIPSTRTIAAISTRPTRLFPRPLPSSYPRRPFSSSPLIMAAITVHSTLKPGPPVPFVPREEGAVSWYACGPTVYDLSHLGHARNYVSTDIIRRILMHYFDYKVNFVMNYTDVDDKIIIKARRKRLLELEKEKPYTAEQIRDLIFKAFQAYTKNLPLLVSEDATPLDEKNYQERKEAAYGVVLAGGPLVPETKPGDAEAKVKMHLNNMDAAAEALKNGSGLDAAEDVLLPYLDSLYKETIDTSDQTIFTNLTKTMEQAFADDMEALNVLPPDVITRVTEYVPQIVAFVEQIVQKGFAYEADGSVYFDIGAFEKAGNTYARLRPESKNDTALQEEGEGSLSTALGGKKRSGDFALWKKSKPGEPYWPSPWGAGRPGWHIECSVMASDKLGEQMDIHSGGIDLAFPHHDNELAQSEAYFHDCCKGEHTWVKYFLHMGHLSIAGSKMSKSLKNFQTIQDALASTYTARNMRIVFLLSRWNDGVEISPDMRKQADNWETTLDNFFTNIKARLSEVDASSGIKDLSLSEDAGAKGLLEDFDQAKKDLDAALRNSFDTPTAMQVLLKLVRNANIYMNSSNSNVQALESVARWVTKIVGIFGLDANAQPPYEGGLGWSSATASNKANVDPQTAVKPYAAVFNQVKQEVAALDLSSGNESIKSLLEQQNPDSEFAELEKSGEKDAEKLALPFIRATSKLRDELRTTISSGAALDPKVKQAILALSDRIRDYDLTDLGVQLDDRVDGPSLVKFVPAAKLIQAREEKAALLAEKARQKEEARKAKEKAEQEKWEKAKLPPQELFKNDAKYTEFDADGLPTKLADGNDVPKAQVKKLKKEWEKQKKLHEEYLAKFGSA
ncbi:tRNA synthetases class I (C) catalytic domain-containing protein [Neurospora tetraspora]|uniref:cysteine--tRNA ligase n=1 Tax=Neurospora tetraspora TaxID=94610 RepID=A0AAE0JCE9_9PEZI|nr:tRNA synthetases class I (C) catalytic domain-containing protein [Neurospora tetraspora]